MGLNELKLEYENLNKNYDEVKATNFVDRLVRLNNSEALDFHYKILTQTENEYLFYEIRGDFYRHGKQGKSFLLEKLKNEEEINLKAEALFILGTLDDLNSQEVDLIKKTASEFLNIRNSYKTEYYGIIVLGWIGSKEEVAVLASEMMNNDDSRLRAYSATALRQVWYNNSQLKKNILKCYYEALLLETNDDVIGFIIACVQDLLEKKLGIKESMKGEISGDLIIAKPKAVKTLKTFLKVKN